MQQTRINTVDDPEFWEQLYRDKRTQWDLGKAAPPLVTYLKSPYAVKPGRILVLGCGNGHDCMLFAQAGFEVTGIDFSVSAITSTLKKFEAAKISGTRGFLLQRDVFDIHEYDGYYDYILEHCFFSAIDPSRRKTYVYTMRDLLKPGGKHIGLWWMLDSKQGPPFSFARDEFHRLFDEAFLIDFAYEPQDSVSDRRGKELLTVMTRR